MPKRINTSQLKSQLRNAVRKAEREMKRDMDKATKKAEQEWKREVGKLNRAAARKQKRAVAQLGTELRRLNNQSTPVRHTVLLHSNITVRQSFQRLEQRWVGRIPDTETAYLLELARQDAAASTAALNALEDNEVDEVEAEDLRLTEITDLLAGFGLGLEGRWRGAIDALRPTNEEAARHFCTSAREILTVIFEKRAPDNDVADWNHTCQRTDKGTPTRREKLSYMLARKGLPDAEIESYMEDAIEDTVKLFNVFNPATHGVVGLYNLEELYGLKERTENSLKLLSAIAI